MRPWQQWNRYEWSEALLASYFRICPDVPTEPVRILVVTDDRLCQVVGEGADAGEEVRRSLITKTVRSVGTANYWKYAADQVGEKPSYLAYLIVACIAAIDKADLDDRSFLNRLDEMTELPASQSIELMAKLWERLQAWLAERPDVYRPLVLPDPGGWTRIGHTTRLAFPSRPDQTKLRHVLSQQGVQEDPPLTVVVSALERRRREFSKRFVAELDDFERALRSGASTHELYETPLWSAVVAASSLEVDAAGVDGRSRWTILGVDNGYEIDVRVVTSGSEAPDGYVLVDCEDFGDWTQELQTDDGTSALPDLLAGTAPPLGGLQPLAKGGLIPMLEASHGAMEVASKRDLEFSSVAFVATSLVDEVQARFGGTRAALNGSLGWWVLRGARLRTAAPESLEGSVLRRCWMLHNTPFPASLRLLGGIRVGDAYLGRLGSLPRIRAAEAVGVSCQVGATVVELDDVDGDWSFPSTGIVQGDCEVVVRASFPVGERVRRVPFVSAPSVEAFKELGDPPAWLVEGTARAQSFPSAAELFAPDLCDPIADIDSVVRLGRDVGVFASSSEDTTWEISGFGSARSGRLLHAAAEATPTGRTSSQGRRRRWRQHLNGARFADDSGRELARRILASGRADKELPITDSEGTFALVQGPTHCPTQEQAGVAELVDICVSLANRKAGMEPSTWRRLGQEALGLDRAGIDGVSRAWSEAHLLEEVVSRRWSTRRMVLVSPYLLAFRTQRWIGASLQGLALPATRGRLRDAASAEGILVETVRSRSGLIPEGLAFRCDSIEQLRLLAERTQLTIRYLRSDSFQEVAGRDMTATAPRNYERSTYTSNLPVLGGVSTTRWWRSGAPGFWTVSSDRYFAWTHFEASAAFWAVAVAGDALLSPVGNGVLRSDVAYLPLSVARWLNAISLVRSGPDPTHRGAHCYEAPTEAFAETLVNRLAGFVQSRLTELIIPGRE